MDAVQMLEEAGFRVFEATNAEEAITLLETHLDINLVFTDIDMPGAMNGVRLAQAVRGRWPPIKIIATSGHSNFSRDDLPPGSLFIPKPYGFPSIVSAIRELTGRQS
jgi:CheY-like chemotaxis protein